MSVDCTSTSRRCTDVLAHRQDRRARRRTHREPAELRSQTSSVPLCSPDHYDAFAEGTEEDERLVSAVLDASKGGVAAGREKTGPCGSRIAAKDRSE